MRILIIDPDRAERTVAEKILSASSHDVRFAADAESGLASVDSFNPDVVLVDLSLGRVSGLDVVKRIRAAELTGHRYVIVTMTASARADLNAVFAAGADDFVRKPYHRDELLVRVLAPVRIRQWAARLIDGMGSPAGDLTQLLAWREASKNVSQDLAMLFGMAFAIESSAGVLADATTVAMLPLCIAEDEQDLSVYLGMDESASQRLGELMFCHSPCTKQETRDLVNETVNLAAGALKRAFTAEGKVLTTGLPRVVDAADARTGVATQEWRLASVDGVVIHVLIVFGEHRPCLVPVLELREGMVLRTDVRTAGGGLLLKQGTRLTDAHLPRLVDALGPKRLVEVADAA